MRPVLVVSVPRVSILVCISVIAIEPLLVMICQLILPSLTRKLVHVPQYQISKWMTVLIRSSGMLFNCL